LSQYDWPIGVGSQDDRDGILKAVQQIEDEVKKLETEAGIPRSRIVLGGFSQGGSIALIAAYRKRKDGDSDEPYAGCIALSGWLTLVKDLEADGMSGTALQSTPLFWGHGQYDDKVLFEQQAFGINKLTELGMDKIEATQYPMGHESCNREMLNMATFLHSVLFQDEGDGDKTTEAEK